MKYHRAAWLALALAVPALAQDFEVRTTREGQIVENPAKMIEIVSAPEPPRAAAPQDPRAQLEVQLSQWDDRASRVARDMIAKYGTPQEVTAQRLIWHRNGSWLRTEVTNDMARHDVPTPHVDMLTQVVRYPVPTEVTDELTKFHPGITVDRAKGELAVRCAREDANLLALNLADELARGRRSVDDARKFFARAFDAQGSEYLAYKSNIRFERVATAVPVLE